MTRQIDHMDTENMVCPYCGYEEDETLEYPDYGVEECPECGREFVFSSDTIRYFSSSRYSGRTSEGYAFGPKMGASHLVKKCGLCGKVLDSDHDYPALYQRCPVCQKIVCHECEADRRPCCEEYKRWSEEEA
ncbi:hypothetical protein BOCO_0413 [Bombiscardovia coagulans]|uniref:Uncharacterized protein n=1 Tax=Bombiscardovia coagulans TaxID=686666 RepID=A0A261ETA5_9BIFI|nr:hypothetical protein BOCO_0413 [Bombiscardovia coagulans]